MMLLFKVINDKIVIRGEKNVVFRCSNILQFITCRNKNNNTADILSYSRSDIFLLVKKIF